MPEYEESDQNKLKEAVRHWLRKHTGWLLILDNIEDLNLLQQFVPVDRQGAVLLTTRRQVTEPVAQALELELLPENDAILFLLKRTKVLAVDMILEDAHAHDIEAARTITRLLDNLPLALDQAGAYILETPCSFAEYLTLFQTYQSQLLQRRIGKKIPTDHPESVAATFRLNFQQVQQRSEIAGELLRLFAFLASDAIPEEILTADVSSLGPVLAPVVADPLRRNQAIEVLRAYSLIGRNPTEKTLSIHRLVQAVLQDVLEDEERRIWAVRAMQAINAAFPYPNARFPQPQYDPGTWPRCERLLPHLSLVTQYIETNHSISEEIEVAQTGDLLYSASSYLRTRARYAEAELLSQRLLRIFERYLGPEHLYMDAPFRDLAMLYSVQGKYAEAEPLYKRALYIREQRLGPDHPDVADPLNDLAGLYRDQGKYAEAEALHQRALHIREQYVGPEHPAIIASLYGLANIYSAQDKYTKAEALYQRALHIGEQYLGPEHPNVVNLLNNLAACYSNQGKYTEAELLYKRALRIQEQELGPDHLNVAYLLNNLAICYREQSKYTEAELLYKRALHTQEQKLGPEHPDVARALDVLAVCYREQSKYAEAELLLQRSLHIMEQNLGSEHPETARIVIGFARLRQAQGNSEEARTWYVRALAIYKQAFGVYHPKTTQTRKCLIALLRSMRR